MDEIIRLILVNLEQVGLGMLLFLGAYISNMGLGAYKSVKIDGKEKIDLRNWDKQSSTYLIAFENNPDGVNVTFEW